MKYKVDLHTHTTASGHAYSSLQENIEMAVKKGMTMLGISDHAPAMPGSASAFYFQNMVVIPKEVDGLRILKGVEANILNFDGDIDVMERELRVLDYVIASLHVPCIKSGTKAENTGAIIRAMENPRVNIIAHPDDLRFPLDYNELMKAAKENRVLLEINNSSLNPEGFRKEAKNLTKEILKYSIRYDHPVILGSDAHISYDVCNFEYSQKLLNEVDFPEDLVINASIDKLLSFLGK